MTSVSIHLSLVLMTVPFPLKFYLNVGFHKYLSWSFLVRWVNWENPSCGSREKIFHCSFSFAMNLNLPASSAPHCCPNLTVSYSPCKEGGKLSESGCTPCRQHSLDLLEQWRVGKWHLVRFCRQSMYTFTKYSNPGGILIGAKERFSFTKTKTNPCYLLVSSFPFTTPALTFSIEKCQKRLDQGPIVWNRPRARLHTFYFRKQFFIALLSHLKKIYI